MACFRDTYGIISYMRKKEGTHGLTLKESLRTEGKPIENTRD
jgi:hypothetical protein